MCIPMSAVKTGFVNMSDPTGLIEALRTWLKKFLLPEIEEIKTKVMDCANMVEKCKEIEGDILESIQETEKNILDGQKRLSDNLKLNMRVTELETKLGLNNGKNNQYKISRMRGNKPSKQFNSDQLDAVSSICDDGYLDRQGQ